MWLRVGSYPDRELAMEMASKLRNAGVRVEVKEYVEWDLTEKYLLKGKLGELEEYEEAQEWKRYADIIRELIRNGMEVEAFEREFLKRAMPEEFEIVEKARSDEITDDELVDAVDAMMKLSLLLSSVYGFLKANGIEVGEYIQGNLPEDPEIIIELDDWAEGCEKVYYLDFVPSYEISVDVLSAIRGGAEIHGMEGAVVDAASRVLMNLIAGIDETNDIEELKNYAVGVIEDSKEFDADVYVDAEEVFEIMLRSLEKAGVIRISGKKVKFRR
ncbi:hypothetical protein [Archaeoglobus neptunius]|uniref:hypothetical protein n=1 Tax=Archaeoglobus neptunius TaxID=2798580 RepID=UPI00192585E1|nr:hypothetical protein [Archaeoglobus neptunius]